MAILDRDDGVPSQLLRRRDAAQRAEPLACGCRDPWPCRCHDDEPSEHQLDAYRDAAEHLLGLNLLPAPNAAAMRQMWRRGGDAQRLARHIAERWEMTA